jgi:uncharacterized membrane protein (Fun14 family)
MENKKRKKRLKPVIKKILLCFFVVLFSILSYFLLTKGLDNKKVIKINYKQNNNIDYKVYLKPNSFFETPFLPKDSTYISTLIDYIDTNFNFNMKYNKNVVGNYTYFVRATIMANKTDNNDKSYLTKQYDLTNNVTGTINNKKGFAIKQNVKIDYQKYNELLTEFKREYGLTIDGKLKVKLIVNTTANCSESSKPIVDSSSMNVEIPLTQQSVDISINTNSQAKNNTITLDTVTINDLTHKAYMVGGVVSVILVLISIISLIKMILYEKGKISTYNKELNNILSTYDSIIVSVHEVKDLSKYNIIRVNSFEELLDAHNEIRMPINFIEIKKNKKSLFFLISEDIVWLYELKSEYGENNEKD